VLALNETNLAIATQCQVFTAVCSETGADFDLKALAPEYLSGEQLKVFPSEVFQR
jgi:hypothetical protein